MTGAVAAWKGFRFGMLLQLAVGPVCLFVFQTASAGGFAAGMAAVAGVVLVDGLYILLAMAGVAAFVGRPKVHAALNIFGAVVLCLFGVSMILGVFGVSLLPALRLTGGKAGGSFLRAAAVTASNPLTILFWAGVFSSRVSQENMQKRQAACFGLGAVLSTLFFLSLVAALGSALKQFLPDAAVMVLNAAVGALLLFFGVRMVLPRRVKNHAD